MPDVMLDPLQEILFQAWIKANGLKKEPKDPLVDLRGVYQDTKGHVPPGRLLVQLLDHLERMKLKNARDKKTPATNTTTPNLFRK